MQHKPDIRRSPEDSDREAFLSGTASWLDGERDAKRRRRLSPQNCAAALILIDVLAIAGAGATALDVSESFGARLIAHANMRSLALALVVTLYLLIAYFADVYDERRIFAARRGTIRAAVSVLATFAFAVLVGVAAGRLALASLEALFIWGSSALLIVTAVKFIVLHQIAAAVQSGRIYVTRVLTIGVGCDPVEAADIARRSGNRARATHAVRVECIGDLADLSEVVALCDIDRVYVSSTLAEAALIPSRLRLLQRFSCEAFVAPDDRRIAAAPKGAIDSSDYIATTIIDIPIDRWRLWSKRLQDILIATTALALAAPLLLALALAIRIESPGPVLTRRHGASDGRSRCEFWMFRSTQMGDARVTRVGRLMRRTSLDRLPLFLNVLQGRLSIVGPRPYWADGAPPDDPLTELSTRYAASHRVNPGLTGLAQVEGFRGELECATDVNRRVALDWAYIEKRSIWLDLQIMMRTIAIVVTDCVADRCAAP
jgi:polysaccharide biosynthesis protein PslA